MKISSPQKNQSKRGKGGRPPKKVRRENILMVRLTLAERFLIESKARQAGMRPSEWFRRAAKRAQIVARLSPEELGAFRMLVGLANNLNQLARLAHRDGLLSVQRKCREILVMINDTLTNLNSDDRKSDHR